MCGCGCVGVFVGVCVCGCGMLICFVSALGSHVMGRHKLPIIIIIIVESGFSYMNQMQMSDTRISIRVFQ